ncbi:fimbria/pilus outer membrane usher protein [Ramlibacter tataouinensis]|uniref:fimbria/pilus outer membrane usher protein n=1 Tax=Ramlibacter tataouinensis TaxID=94132 RepID=UPI00131443EA|nr:fimbria/pilus outer membrane usher protein [Ramlibacter tataouinensis]
MAVSAVLAMPLGAQPIRSEAPTASPLAVRIVPLEATVNGLKVGTWTFVERQGQLFVGKDALDEWRLEMRPGTQPIAVRGAEYWPLDSVPGFSFKVNYSQQSVEINFAPEAFAATRLAQPQVATRLSPVLTSFFVNYDLNLQATKVRDTQTVNNLGALVELGTSGRWGVLTSSHVGRDLSHSKALDSGWLRLETTFTRHMPEINRTLRIGDSATVPGLWGSSVYFGGVQFGTNYTLSPGLITQPLPLVSGVSAAPSTVQLYVNDVLRKTTDVPAGPFVIENFNEPMGSGEAKLVVRDILGRETVIVQRYFTSGQLLAPSLSDWNVAAGSLRRGIGLTSNEYGPGFASGTWRRGLTNLVTVEARGEFTADTQTAGVGLLAGLPFDFLGRAALAGSTASRRGSGQRWLVGAERQWTDSAVFFQATGASRDFVELGRPIPSKLEWAASAARDLGALGRVGFNLVGVERFEAPSITTASAQWSKRLPKNSWLNVNLSRAMRGSSASMLGVSVTIPLDQQRVVDTAVNAHKGGTDFYASATSNSSIDLDFGWRVLGGRINDEAHAEAGLYYGGQYGRVYSDLSASGNQQTIRGGATGGIAWADGHTFFTKRVDQSFVIAEVKGYGDVGVGLGSYPTTKTNADGIALVPYVSPYQANQVRLNANDLPLSAEVESIEQVVVPAWRSAVKAQFAVRSGKAALIKVEFDDAQAAPAGAVLAIEGDKEEFYVARKGEAYVTGLQPSNVVKLTWKNRACSFQVKLPAAANDEVLRLGPYRCMGVAR